MKHVVDLLKLVVAGAVLMMLAPVAVNASGQLVTLVDRDSTVESQVDPGGKLRVGDGNGPLTVDGVVGGSYRGRTPYTDWCALSAGEGEDFDICTFSTVPAGKILVVTQVSSRLELPSSQSIAALRFDTVTNSDPNGSVWLGFDQRTTVGSTWWYTYSHHTEVAVLGGETPRAIGNRTATTGTMSGNVHVFGYLTNG